MKMTGFLVFLLHQTAYDCDRQNEVHEGFFYQSFRYAFVFQTKIKIKISDFYCMKIDDMV